MLGIDGSSWANYGISNADTQNQQLSLTSNANLVVAGVASGVVVLTTAGATSDGIVGNMKTQVSVL